MERLLKFPLKSFLLIERFAARFPWLYAFTVVPATFILMAMIFPPAYDTNDDVSMSFIASGKVISTEPDEHLVYTHPYIGLMLKHLYIARPLVPWYGLYLLTTQIVAHSVIAGLMLNRNSLRRVFPWFSLWVATLGFFWQSHTQFTSTAFLAGLAGFLLLWEAARLTLEKRQFEQPWLIKNQLSLLPFHRLNRVNVFVNTSEFLKTITTRRIAMMCIAGAMLLWWCELIRWRTFYFWVCLPLPVVAFWLLAKSADWRFIRNVALVAAFVACGGIGFRMMHVAYYEADPDWAGFLKFNSVRINYNDHDLVRYSPSTFSYFTDAGWSLNDINMINAWCYDDPRVFSHDHLSQIYNANNWMLDHFQIRHALEALTEFFCDTQVISLGCILIVLLYKNRKNRLALGATAIAMMTSLAFLVMISLTQKPPPQRIYIPIASWPVVTAVWFAFQNRSIDANMSNLDVKCRLDSICSARFKAMVFKWTHTPPKAAYLGLLCVFLTVAVVPTSLENYAFLKDRRANEKHVREYVAKLDVKPTQLYVAWGTALKTDNLAMLDNYEWLKDFRVMHLGWSQASGVSKKMKAKFGIDNLLADWHKHPELIYIGAPICQQFFGTYSLEHNKVGLEIHPVATKSYFGSAVSRFLPVTEVAKEPSQTISK